MRRRGGGRSTKGKAIAMNKRDPLNLEITSDPAELPQVRQIVRAWTARHGWTDDQTADIVLAVDEALSNVIRHGYGGRPGHKIDIGICALHDREHGVGLQIRIRDFGKQVPIERICGRNLDDVRPGGLGVHIIRSVMISAEYSHAAGGGMQLIMRKYQRPSTGDKECQAGEA
jgi:anti-sigma regulatory factor (Ser/Thr protein kinase)